MDRTQANGRRFTSRRRVPIWISGDYRDYNFSYSVDSTDNDDDDEDDYGAGDDSQDTENDAYRLDNDYTDSARTVSKDESTHCDGTASWDLIAWEDDYCDSILSGQPLSTDKERSMLIEVDLKVMARYRRDLQKGQPIISMTSKLNGNSIIRHSIQIEAVEDGFSDHLLVSNCDMANEAMENYPLPSAGKTASRNLIFDRAEAGVEFSGQHETSPKKGGVGGSVRKGLLVLGGGYRNSPPQVEKSLSSKTSKKGELSSILKIRTLSSTTLETRTGKQVFA